VHVIIEPGFFASAPVRTALVVGAIVAVVSAVVGIITVIRSQSFAGHALTDVATTGGAAASYLGVSTLAGFLGAALVGAGAMETIGVQRARRRDVATGIVLGAATGLSALFLYLDATSSASTGVTQQVLFGSIFTVTSSTVVTAAVTALVVLVALAVMWRPLLLASVSPEIAAARGVRVRTLGLLFVLTMATAVGLSSITIGSILSTALLIGPPAAGLRLTRSVPGAVVVSTLIGVVATWLGILLAYDSYYWDASSQGLPVSFFIVVVVVVIYLVSGTPWAGRHRRVFRTLPVRTPTTRPTQGS
jgi:zinc/manganese transport system permease protein